MLAIVSAAVPFAAAYSLAWYPGAPVQARAAVLRMEAVPEAMPEGMAMPGMPGDAPQIISEETYGMMLSTLLKTEKPVAQEISANYAMVDYAFLQKLEEAIANDDPEQKERLSVIKEAVNEEMAKRMQQAAEALREVLQSPTPVIMEGKIAGLARQGRIDDALMQLLQANLEQAQAAGEAGAGAVAVMSKLKERVQTEVDAKLPPQSQLLRQLLRMDDPVARESLLREKMSPKKKASIILLDGDNGDDKEEDLSPDVSPRLLAQSISELKSRFGNVDENYDTGFVQKLEAIADQAEAVALDLAGGEELSAKQQQDLMWDRATVSVWDLEAVEEEAHQDGNFAVWEEEAQKQLARQENAQREANIMSDFQQ